MNLTPQALAIDVILLSIVISFGVSYFSWKGQKYDQAAQPFFLIQVVLAGWLFALLMFLISQEVRAKQIWVSFQAIISAFFNPFLLQFALKFNRTTPPLPKKIWALIWSIQLAFMLLAATNSTHEILWQGLPDSLNGETFQVKLSSVIYRIYSFCLSMAATFIFARQVWHQRKIFGYRFNIVVILICVSVLSNFLPIFARWASIDFLPIILTLISLATANGILRFHFASVAPHTHRLAYSMTQDPILTLDHDGMLLQINPAAERILEVSNAVILGQPLSEIFPQLQSSSFTALVANSPNLINVEKDGSKKQFELSVVPFPYGDDTGGLLLLHDVTNYQTAQSSLRQQSEFYASLTAVAKVLDMEVDIETAVPKALATAISLTHAHSGSLVLLDETFKVERGIRVADGQYLYGNSTNWELIVQKGLANWVISEKKGCLIDDVLEDPRWFAMVEVDANIRSVLAVPLAFGDFFLGILMLHHQSTYFFNSQHFRLMKAVSEQIVLSLRSAKMVSDLATEENNQRLLFNLSQLMGNANSVQEALEAGLAEIGSQLPFDMGFVLRRLPLRKRFSVSACFQTDAESAHRFLEQIDVRPFLPESPLYFENSLREETADFKPDEHLFNQAVKAAFSVEERIFAICIPLRSEKRYHGLLLLKANGSELFIRKNHDFYKVLGAQIATVIENIYLQDQTQRQIDEQKILYQTVSSQKSRMKALFESSGNGIIDIDTEGRIQIINQRALTLFGLQNKTSSWQNESFLNLIYATNLSAEDKQALLFDILAKQGKEPDKLKIGYFEINGRFYSWQSSPILTGLPRPIGQLLSIVDISARRQTEVLREDLIHTIVHDLRNPLGAITGSVDIIRLLSGDQIPPNAAKFLLSVEESAERMDRMISQILDVNRLENGQLPLHLERVNIANLIESATVLQQTMAQQQNISLVQDIDTGEIEVMIDRQLLMRVLQNLLDNGIKFSLSNGEVHISAQQYSERPDHIIISVANGGNFILPEIQKTLFDKYVTGAKKLQGSSGLGLYFCRLVIEAHGQEIWVESDEENMLTVFKFLLPMPQQAASGLSLSGLSES